MRLGELETAVKRFGVELVSGAKHFKFVGPNGKTYPCPGHNGKKSEVPREYVKGLCRCFGIVPEDLL